MATPRLEHDWFPRPVPSNVSIGPRSWCYSSYAFLHYHSKRACGVRIGHDTGVYKGTHFDLGPDGEVLIGDYCTLVGAIISTNRKIVIGDFSFLAHEVVLADHAAMMPWTDRSALDDKKAPGVRIGRNCWIGARAVLLAGAQIGEGAIVGAAAVVDVVVPPYTIIAGNPARIVGAVKK